MSSTAVVMPSMLPNWVEQRDVKVLTLKERSWCLCACVCVRPYQCIDPQHEEHQEEHDGPEH